ncbi:hypothetical protein [Clostridium perfringens]|uniref:Uncharacterized protein n=1 Tax=Clostridium perfringens TaxID=1502 RepID=A0A133NCB9_CLOPF|nr:hypothetical protein [Clostridium perfringens]ELC8332621.1 hypothetical protein [Clostridium perfringens]KXA13928.1 hypothetical protein HMPREF3222_00622 [Clostridium perfringens]MBS5920682.1 hypothetical protein [Clostridium perfringens]MDK0980109.1 hypothetical protein [Clostridium perfringens]MDU3019235.1 hypothetical protein [Clostridium perfringens]
MNERICVNTRKAMKDAIDDKYKTIIVTGEIVDDVKREVNNSKKGVINKLSNVSLIGGIFLWPLLIAGLAGKVLSKDDFKKYNVEIQRDSIVLTRKK